MDLPSIHRKYSPRLNLVFLDHSQVDSGTVPKAGVTVGSNVDMRQCRSGTDLGLTNLVNPNRLSQGLIPTSQINFLPTSQINLAVDLACWEGNPLRVGLPADLEMDVPRKIAGLTSPSIRPREDVSRSLDISYRRVLVILATYPLSLSPKLAIALGSQGRKILVAG